MSTLKTVQEHSQNVTASLLYAPLHRSFTNGISFFKKPLPKDGDSLPSSNPESRSLSLFLCLCPRCLWRRWLFLPPSGTWTPMNKVLWPIKEDTGYKCTWKERQWLVNSVETMHCTRRRKFRRGEMVGWERWEKRCCEILKWMSCCKLKLKQGWKGWKHHLSISTRWTGSRWDKCGIITEIKPKGIFQFRINHTFSNGNPQFGFLRGLLTASIDSA